jgi:hypothetical protein
LNVKYRQVVIFTGRRLRVPEHIRRIDTRNTHGWQLRYGKWLMFSDHSNDGSGAKRALDAATAELVKRIRTLPAPTKLKGEMHADKRNALPVGISGPNRRLRNGRTVTEFYLAVSIPRFGNTPTNTNVYIGTENTVTKARYKEALAKAVEIRTRAEQAYKRAATKAKRASSTKRELL